MINAIDGRIIEKISTVAGQEPTVAPSFDHTDGTWSVTDIYEGEFFINTTDEKVFTRCGTSIIEITGGAGSPSDLETTLGVGNTTGPNWIEVQSGYGLESIDGTISDKIRVDPSLVGGGTGIQSADSSTGEGSKLFIKPTDTTIRVIDGGDITDTISVDPQGLGNGTGIRSENTSTSEAATMIITPNSSITEISDSGLPTSTMSQSIDNIVLQVSDGFTTGTVALTLSTNGINTNLGGARIGSVGGTITTTNASTITISTFIPIVVRTYDVEAIVRGHKTDSTKGITIKLNSSFRVDGSGVVTAFGTPTIITNTEFSTAGATLTTDGTNILVTITGEAATDINWSSTIISNY